ncbi:NADPH-dependent F420 reductase [Herbiconiux daphne]|uniref:NAD(P)-binding domain-containing protein n=1 Tax=Herbiconiux daphne TaxID=2970914 RepID=A0ABT2H566_9MICO|nr:NAD(P)-binding domain-containing protein [Herbiconiux daphne]MCS5735073.1 NAD(P)-binding domain-containing protein [Herbiconiux daphne]
MTTIGFIGSGQMATALAALAIKAGNDVVLSGRPNHAKALHHKVAELGPLARAGSAEDVKGLSDVLFLAIPFWAYRNVDPQIASHRLLIDVTNYYPGMYDPPALLNSGELTSSELIQQHFSSARVVKGFNTIAAHHVLALARDTDADDRSAIPIAANDGAAMNEAATVLDEFGFDAFRVGTLADSWKFGPATPAWVSVYQADPGLPWTIDPGRPASLDRIRVAIDSATTD